MSTQDDARLKERGLKQSEHQESGVREATAFEQWEVVELAASANESMPDSRELELAKLRETAYAEGYAEGMAAGRAKAEQACGQMKQLAESFDNTLDNLDFHLADMVLDLALDVARQVLVGELAVRPQHILDVVNQALKQMAESSRGARLLLNPEDAALVRPHLDKVLDKNRLRVVEDIRIVRGGCLIETPQGDLDATLASRWRQVVQVLGSNQNWLE